MSRLKLCLSSCGIILILAGTAFAQYRAWPDPIPPEPAWGDYDDGHVYHDAGWWWQNQPDWVRQNHPEWWGDFDDERAWRPAAWWWEHQPSWARAHHPEWWGDSYDGQWYPASWWYQYQPDWAREHHPEWWGDFDSG